MNVKTAIYIAAAAALASLLLAHGAANAATYHVAAGGSDSADGSKKRPWQTLQHAAGRVGPGDTVLVGKGRYRGFQLTRSGDDGRPITFRGTGGAVIRGKNPRTDDGINLEGASHVVIQGFTVEGAPRAGIRAVQCQKVVIRDNVVEGNGKWGVFTAFCDDLVIEDNRVSGSRGQHGVYVSNSGDRPVIRRNRIWDNPQNGIHLNGDASMGGDGLITGALVEENIVYGNGEKGGSAINGDGLERSVIRNNLLYANHANGIALYRIDGGGPSRNNRVLHNTIVMPEKSRWCLRIYNAATGTVVKNNILVSQHDYRGALDVSPDSVKGLDSDYNVLIGRFTLDDADSIIDLAMWRKRTKQDAHSVEATPAQLFVKSGSDFSLKKGAPAIDMGTETKTGRDLAGNLRPAGKGPDAGAYERCTDCKKAPVAAAEPPPPAAGDDDDGADTPAAPEIPAAGHPRAGLTYGAPSAPASRVFYVSGGGSDDADGSEGSPWRSLQRAATRVRAGDTVVVRPGTYRGFDIRRSGEQGRPIKFLGGPGVRINRNNPRTSDGINIEGASDIWIEGFEIVGASRAGIRAVDCRRITVRRNKLDQNGVWGVFTGFCDDVLIESNEASRSGEQHGIYVSNSGDRPVIRGNLVWGNPQNGIHMNGDASMGGDGMVSGAVVEDNVIHGNGRDGGSAINCDGVTQSTFRNNLLYDNQANGIALYAIDAARGSSGNTVVHNTIVMPSKTRWCMRIYDGSTGNTVRNNILLSGHDYRGAIDISPDSLEGLTSDYNIVIPRFTTDDAESVMDLDAWRKQHGQDTHSMAATPADLFVDPSDHDYRLKPGSPAVDKAHGDAPGRDVAGRERPAGSAADIGAFEACQGDGCVDAEIPPPDAGRGPGGQGSLSGGSTTPGAADGPKYCCSGADPGGSAAMAFIVFLAIRRRK